MPTAVWGTEKLLPLIEERIEPKDLLKFERPKVFVRIGEVFTQHLRIKPGELDKRRLEALTTNLMLEIRDMLPQEYWGVYTEVKQQPV